MKIYGILIAKNEEDIIEQTLVSLKKYGSFEKIYFYDNESTDGTYNIAKKFEDHVLEVKSLATPFSDDLKYELLNSHSERYVPGDWLVILDADEVYQESLLDKIEKAELVQSNYIESWSAQFYFTEADDNVVFFSKINAADQRKNYLLNYGEPRAFKYNPNFKLSAKVVKAKHPYFIKSPESLLIHHFQYRSAAQTQRRLDIRLKNNLHSNNWGHVNSAKWQDYRVNARYLHVWDGSLRQGLPLGANLHKIRDNAAYTMANLNWLKRNGHLTDEQLKFFSASRIEKIIRKFI